MNDGSSSVLSEVWEREPVIAAAMLGALRENPLTLGLAEEQLLMLVEKALREKCRGDSAWLAPMVARLLAGENLLETEAPLPAEPAKPAFAAQSTQQPPSISIAPATLIYSQDELDAALAAHSLWIKHVLEPGLDLGPGRANLKGSDLRAYNLDGADLRAANLEDCILSGVSLVGAKLAGAKLSRAKLDGACLEASRLRRANLSGADLRGARLRAADLRHAIVKGANFEGADLSEVLGLPETLNNAALLP